MLTQQGGAGAVQQLLHANDMRIVETIASGMDFEVLRVEDPSGAEFAARAFRGARFDSNANDPAVDRRALLVQEERLGAVLAAHGLPVARPLALLSDGHTDVLVSEYLPDDGSRPDALQLGRILARLHAVALPGDLRTDLVASEGGTETGALIVRRLRRRHAELQRIHPDLPPLPSPESMSERLREHSGTSLLHLDVRIANLRCRQGRPFLVDWGNALIGDPGLEAARLSVFARAPSNGIDWEGVANGYGPKFLAHRLTSAWPVYVLDASMMLALVFTSESPDDRLGALWVRHAVDDLDALR